MLRFFNNFIGDFVVQFAYILVEEENKWKRGRIDWTNISLEEIKDLTLSEKKVQRDIVKIGLSESNKEFISTKGENEIISTDRDIDEVFFAKQINDIVPNPWVAIELAENAIEYLKQRYNKKDISANALFIIQELRKILDNAVDTLGEKIFRKMLDDNQICFFLQKSKSFLLKSEIIVNKDAKKLTKPNGESLEKDLFDFVPAEELNDTEKSVAYYLDEQEKLLWWYRNIAKKDYYVQGWRKNKIYPDFIFGEKDQEDENN